MTARAGTGSSESAGVDSERVREVLTHYPTGVAVVTSVDAAGEAAAFVTPVLALLSEEPPLVGFQLDPADVNYESLVQNDDFCLNILDQHKGLPLALAEPGGNDDLRAIDWVPSVSGAPIIAECLGYIACRAVEIHVTGDRKLVVARILEAESVAKGMPLLSFRGGYGAFRPRVSILPVTRNLRAACSIVRQGIAVIERAAEEAGVEVIAMARDGYQMSIIASASPSGIDATTVVGRTFPLVPPYGTLFLADAPEHERENWLNEMSHTPTAPERAQLLGRLARARGRGWSVALAGPTHSSVDRLIEAYTRGPVTASLDRQLRIGIEGLRDYYDPPDDELVPESHIRMLSVPVAVEGTAPVLQLAVHSLSRAITVKDLPALREILCRAAKELASTEIDINAPLCTEIPRSS